MTPPNTLQDRADIADLVHRYALTVRRRDVTGFAALFTADATFEVRALDFADPAAVPQMRSRDVGRADVIAHLAASASGSARVCPSVSNLLIRVEGDSADANCLMTSRVWPGSAQMTGEYDDSFRRENGRWLFSGRIYTIFHSPEPSLAPATDAAGALR